MKSLFSLQAPSEPAESLKAYRHVLKLHADKQEEVCNRK
jgi:hypothetical protein